MPTKPVLGMVFIEFAILCGSDPRDAMKVTDSSGGRTTSMQLAYTDNRASSMCFGYFSFDKDGKLDYISRTNY